MPSYEDALQQTLEALSAAEELEVVLSRFPEHMAALREDVRLIDHMSSMAATAPGARSAARADASRRMLSQLAAERDSAVAKPRWSFGGLGLARYVAAAVVVAIAVLGVGLVLDGGSSTVEAATIEGVVVGNEGDMLTVQTLDTLEQVSVPANTLVSDVAGASIGLDHIEVGQVVVIDVKRNGRKVVAQRIQRYQENIDAWCTDDSARCQVLSEALGKAKHQCERTTAACLVAVERLEQLRVHAMDVARLEVLKRDCRSGTEGACRQVVIFCREHLAICGALPAPEPNPDAAAIRDRVLAFWRDCLAGNDAACRQIAQACNLYANLCPLEDRLPLPEGTPAPSTRPVDVPPSATRQVEPSTAPLRPADTATPVPVRPTATAGATDVRPTSTPVRDPSPTATPTGDGGAIDRKPVEPTSGPARDAATAEPTTTTSPSDAHSDGPTSSDR